MFAFLHNQRSLPMREAARANRAQTVAFLREKRDPDEQVGNNVVHRCAFFV